MADEADQRLREIQGQYLDFLDDEVWIYIQIKIDHNTVGLATSRSLFLKGAYKSNEKQNSISY